jgi:hypothetical protein
MTKTERTIQKKSMIMFAITGLLVAGILGAFATLPAFAATAPSLGTAAPFAVLAYSGITNTGTTTITGNVGSYPTASETGFGTVTITGTNYPAGAPSTTQTDLAGAIAVAEGNTPSIILTALDAQILVPGVYRSASTAFTLSGGVLTLNGAGVYIFQAPQAIAGALTTVAGSVVLENGAQACNVFWVTSAGGAIIGSGTTFVGTIMAESSVTLGSAASLQGAALANTGDVTMNNNNIAVTPCAAQSTTSGSSPVNTPGANCASGLYYGYYTNSITGKSVQFAGLAIGAAVKLITNNPPGALLCQTPTTTNACAYLTILTTSQNGTKLTGLFSDVWTSTGPILGCIPINTNFTAGAFDSGCYVFSHWSDTGSTMRFRAFTISGNTTYTAVYNNVCGPIPSTDSAISVSAIISPNTPATGYYATLWQNGAMLQSCFTACTFIVSNGQSYQVMVSDFGSSVFNHWTDGTTNRAYTVTIGATTTTVDLTAVYN